MSHLVFGFTSIIMFLLSNQLLQVSFCVICLSVPPSIHFLRLKRRTFSRFPPRSLIHPIPVSQVRVFPSVPQRSMSLLLSPVLFPVSVWSDSSQVTSSILGRHLGKHRSLPESQGNHIFCWFDVLHHLDTWCTSQAVHAGACDTSCTALTLPASGLCPEDHMALAL